jgi:ribosomal protein S27AE
MQIVECPRCATKNRIYTNSDNLRPVCGRCGANLFDEKQQEQSFANSFPKENKFRPVLAFIFVVLTVAVAYGILVTPNLIRRDFSSLIAAEARQTEMLKEQFKDKIAEKKALLEEELATINAQSLRKKATSHYKKLLEARKSYDKRFALSPREKNQLRMRNLSSDSTKSFHDAIRSVAREASPTGADIKVNESSKGIALHIDFDMSSMTSGEYGTRTKHHTKSSLRKEVVSLISRVTNDILKFCRGLNISTIHVGCRHYVTTSYPDGSEREENIVLYKIKIYENQIPQLTNNPFLDIYSTTKHFKVDEDNFEEIEIKSSHI